MSPTVVPGDHACCPADEDSSQATMDLTERQAVRGVVGRHGEEGSC